MKFSCYLWGLLGVIHACRGQYSDGEQDRRLIHRRPALGGGSGSPCGYRSEGDDPESRSLFAVLGGAAVGSVVGGAAGYHFGMKNQKPVVINNNVYNQLPSPCTVHVGGGGGGGGGSWSGSTAGSGIAGGLLSNHPILSGVITTLGSGLGSIGSSIGNGIGGWGGGGGIVSNRNIRQFQRQVVRPLSRLFK